MEDLKDPKFFLLLVSAIPKMASIEHIQYDEKVQPWQTNYLKFKNIYQAL